MIRCALACLAVLTAANPSSALELPPIARLQVERISPFDSYALPTGPYQDGGVPAELVEGRVERRSWRADGGSATTLQILAPLRDQIRAEGYEVVFECADRACGGFDFRFATEILPGPHMYVDLGDYRFLSARRETGEVQSLLVTRSAASAYVQQIRVGPAPALNAETVEPMEDPAPTDPESDLIATLLAEGHVILSDLEFKTGANELGDGPFLSLALLATFLQNAEDYRVVLVGHTDSVGRLGANIALSKARAQAVRDRLVQEFDAPADRIDAEGMGFLSPIASNLTKAGREANRRVEAILLRK